MNRDQIWTTEESKWACRNLERETFFNLLKGCQGDLLEIGSDYGRLMENLIRYGQQIFGAQISENLCKKSYQKEGLYLLRSFFYIDFPYMMKRLPLNFLVRKEMESYNECQ